MHNVRVGVVGLGSMGRRHLETLARTEGAQVVAVATRSEDKRADAVTRFGVRAEADYHRLIGSVDAVVVAVPTVLHGEVGRFFLEQGVHVLLEKPIAASVEEARSLIRAAQHSRVTFMIGHIERFNPAYMQLQQVVHDQAPLSGPVRVQTGRMGPYDGRIQDVGVDLDLLIHDIDALAGLFPGCSLQLQSALGMPVVTPLTDTVLAHLIMESAQGLQGSAVLMASRVADAKRRWCHIESAGFRAELDFMNQTLKAATDDGPWQEIPVEKAWPLDGELRHFIDCVRTGEPPAIDGSAGLQALELVRQVGERIRAASLR